MFCGTELSRPIRERYHYPIRCLITTFTARPINASSSVFITDIKLRFFWKSTTPCLRVNRWCLLAQFTRASLCLYVNRTPFLGLPHRNPTPRNLPMTVIGRIGRLKANQKQDKRCSGNGLKLPYFENVKI